MQNHFAENELRILIKFSIILSIISICIILSSCGNKAESNGNKTEPRDLGESRIVNGRYSITFGGRFSFKDGGRPKIWDCYDLIFDKTYLFHDLVIKGRKGIQFIQLGITNYKNLTIAPTVDEFKKFGKTQIKPVFHGDYSVLAAYIDNRFFAILQIIDRRAHYSYFNILDRSFDILDRRNKSKYLFYYRIQLNGSRNLSLK